MICFGCDDLFLVHLLDEGVDCTMAVACRLMRWTLAASGMMTVMMPRHTTGVLMY